MNWGKKIAIVYGVFVVAMLSLVYMCVIQDDITLVSKDYYKDEIAYQGSIDKRKNASALSAPIKIVSDKGKVELALPTECVGSTGTVSFYRPSSDKFDFNVPMNLSAESKQTIEDRRLLPGLWVIKLDWQKEGKSYYKEEKVSI